MPTATKSFQLVDLDRVIFDTARFVAALTEVIRQTEPELSALLQEQFDSAYAKEETFFLLRYLRHTKGNDWFENLAHTIITEHGVEEFILPGARERLAPAARGEGDMNIGIITYGDVIDQRLKLKMLGFEHVPTYFADTPDKAWLIRSWKQPDGRFQLPDEFGGGIAETIILEDDKLRAFDGLPEGAFGVWITQHPDAKQRLAEKELERVRIARSLKESIEQS